MLRLFSILIMSFFTFSAQAQETIKIDDILSSQTIRLSNGQHVYLGGIIARPSAKNYLEKNFIGKAVMPVPEDAPKNRYGEVIAHLKTEEGRWVQMDLVKKGLADVFTRASFREEQKTLLAAQNFDQRIIQANPPVDKTIKGFQIVEGVVVEAVERGRYLYVNFGEDYKKDFTISLESSTHKDFLEEGFNILDLKGKKIRVRGWLDHYNGPFIKVTYPEQIEIL